MQMTTTKIMRTTKHDTYQRMCRFREGECPDGNSSIKYIWIIILMCLDFNKRGVEEKGVGRGENHGLRITECLLTCECCIALVTCTAQGIGSGLVGPISCLTSVPSRGPPESLDELDWFRTRTE